MKHLVFIFCLLCFGKISIVYSQCISVELSIKWENKYDIFSNDSIVCVPNLIITYRNNSNNSYYFLKVSDSRYGYPLISSGLMLQYPYEEYRNPSYLKRAKSHGNYSHSNYNVLIGGMPLFSSGWLINNDTINFLEEDNSYLLADCLADIYEYIYREKQPEVFYKKIYFSESDILPKSIKDTIKEQFVFLKPGESYTDIYNLVAFQLVKGNFTFIINQNSFPDYVNIDPIWDSNQSKYMENRASLPAVVDGYNLYSGHFNSNTVTITFLK
jgi:hypothetical protein